MNLTEFFLTDWGIPISITVGMILVVAVPMIVLSNDYASRLEIEEQGVIKMTCPELKQYIIDDLQDTELKRHFVQKAKGLYEWKCEK